MSRAGPTKAKAEKNKPPASQTPVITHEIVPGKFNDHDWNCMLERDSSEDFILDMIDEVLGNTMSIIYDKYIGRQLLPFTITLAKEAILQVVEWQFLTRDGGESAIESDPSWLEDEEPDPAVTDCWAQGCVPKRVIDRPITPVAAVLEDVEEENVEKTDAGPVAPPGSDEMEERVSDSDEAPEEVVPTAPTAKSSAAKTEPPAKQKKFRPYKGSLRSAGVSRMTESLQETELRMSQEAMAGQAFEEQRASALLNMPASCQSLLRAQAGRPPGSKDVVYDQTGKVMAVVRLNPDKLPHHRVKVTYAVTDPMAEAAQSKLDAMRRGKVVGLGSNQSVTQRKSKTMSTTSHSNSKKEARAHVSSVTPLPPPLVENMDIAPGVTVREGDWVRKGPDRPAQRPHALTDHQAGLRPVATRIHIPNLDVTDLLDRTTPILRPLGDTPPLPPIMPQPPSYPKVSS